MSRISLVLVSLLAVLPALAADFPDKPIRMILPFPPGGGADSTARLMAQKLSVRLGQTVIVDNRPGANGAIGTGAVAKGPADGYTLLITDRGALGINPSLQKKLPYDPLKDFAYVGIAATSPYVLIQNAARAPRTLPALVSAAKEAGCKMNYASFGIGSLPQMGIESLNAHYGTCITHVPYKGGGPALMAAMAGEVDITLASIGIAVGGIKEGRIVPIVQGGAQRSRLLPQVPTVTEMGGPADLLPGTWFGLAYPAQTPRAIVDRVSAELRAVLAMPEVRAQLVDAGFDVGAGDPAQMAQEVKADVARFARLAERIGIQPE